MSRAPRTVTVATVASLGLLVGGLATVAGLSGIGSGAAPTTTAAGATTTAGLVTVTQVVTAPTESSAETTTNPGFADGDAASRAAEELLAGYVASQHDVDVTDPACSQPPTGAVGETFACYALKPGDLVIALRATIGDDRLVTLELITNQSPTTTSTTSTTVADTETTTG